MTIFLILAGVLVVGFVVTALLSNKAHRDFDAATPRPCAKNCGEPWCAQYPRECDQ